MLKKIIATFALLTAGVFAGQLTVLEIERDLADGSIIEFDSTLFKGVAATSIDAALIGDGTVSSAEFQRLDGLTDDITTLLAAKEGTVTWSAVAITGGTITGGTITGITDLAISDGGTGASTAILARAALGLTIDTDVQAYSALLADIAAETFASGDLIQYDGANLVNVGSATIRQNTANDQTGTTYTLALADTGKTVWMNNGSANVLTIPANSAVAFAVGTTVTIYQEGSGQTTVTADTGVTLNGASAGSAVFTAQFGGATLIKRATDTWVIYGGLN